jgi:SPX domain protein involved in polyphosphate accumulation
MRRKKVRKSIHDQLVSKLEEKLREEEMYDEIQTFWKYSNKSYAGEIDIFARKDKVYTFYEVKSNLTTKSRNTAQNQFERFQLAFPTLNVEGYLYTGGDLIKL